MSEVVMTIDPEPQEYLEAQYDRDPVLAARIDDFLDVLEDDPHDPEIHKRAHALRDANGEYFSAATVRSAVSEAMVFWREETDDSTVLVRVIYIGDNTLRL